MPEDLSIHQMERLDRKGRRFIAFATLLAIVIIGATWIGLGTFLGTNTAFGTVDDVRAAYIPDVKSMTLDLPEVSRLSEIYTSDGVLLGKLTERNSQPASLDEIPNLVKGAVLAAEDADFMTHGGVDYEAVVRALIQDLGGGPTQGGSTITQQVVKQNFIGNEPTLKRKVAEAAIAIELERRFTKEQILEFYLNSIFFGNNAYGVKAAAQEYFGKDLSDLTIAEAAALPVPIRNPSLYNLRNDSPIPLRARNAVIEQMVEEGYITPEEGSAAKEEPLATVAPQEAIELAPQVVIAAKDEILNNPEYGLGATALQRKRAVFGCPASDTDCEGGGGLKIYTTVDFELQQTASDLLKEWFPPGEEGPTGAIAMVDNRTGATIVMASGLEEGESEGGQLTYDFASRGRRNPGSAFKTFGLVAALEQGIPLRSYWDASSPQVIDFGGLEPWRCAGGFDGIRSLEEALIFSTNAVFCQVSVTVGPENIVDVAHRMGIKSPLGAVPAIVLGAQAVSPLEMAAAYSTLANFGLRAENYLIERIEDSNGNIIYQHQVKRERVLDQALSAAVVRTMEQGVAFGTGTAARIGRPQGGKTGTHENHTDVWFVGYIPQYTTSVWVGFPFGQVEMRNLTINGRFHDRAWGGTVAAPIWKLFMDTVVDGLPVEDFPPNPDGIGVYYQTPRVEVPDVVGLDFEEAQEELRKVGLDSTIKQVNSDEDEDEVVETDPVEGTRVPQGSTVELQVSNGKPPEVELPNLVGMTRNEARDELRDLRNETEIDFDWTFISDTTDDPDQDGLVSKTQPGAGSLITEKTTVRVTVLEYEAPPTTTTTAP